MSKNKLLLLSIPLAAIAAQLVYMLMGSGSDSYLCALPKDATAIARLDVAEFVDELDFSEAERKQLLWRCAQVDEVSDIGLDLRRPLYGFATQKGDFGVVAAVADDDAFARLCKSYYEKGMATETVRQRGYYWTVVQGQWVLAFDSKKALLMGPAVGAGQEQVRTEMARLLSQDRDESGEQQTLFQHLKAGEALTAVVTPELVPSHVHAFLRPFGIHPADGALLSLSLDFDDEEADLQADVLAESAEAKAALKQTGTLFRPLKGQLLRFISSSSPLWLTANVQGSVLLDRIRQTSARGLLVALNMVLDADRIIESFDGDIAVEMSRLPSSLSDLSALAEVSLTAKIASSDFLRNSSSWGNAWINVERLSDQTFRLNWESAPLFFGVEDDVFYMGARPLPSRTSNAHPTDVIDDLSDKRFYAIADLQALMQIMGLEHRALPPIVRQMERLDVMMGEPGNFSLRFTAPKGTNIAKEVFLAP